MICSLFLLISLAQSVTTYLQHSYKQQLNWSSMNKVKSFSCPSTQDFYTLIKAGLTVMQNFYSDLHFKVKSSIISHFSVSMTGKFSRRYGFLRLLRKWVKGISCPPISGLIKKQKTAALWKFLLHSQRL